MSIARHFRSLLFLVLIAGLGAGAMLAQRGATVDLGTYAGVQLKLSAPAVTPTSVVPSGLFSNGAQTTPSAAIGAQATGRLTTGTVQALDGQSISVTAQDGTVTKATVSTATTYVKSATITATDIQVGDNVTVMGQAGTDGAITATQVTVGAAGQAAAAGAFTRQGGAGAAGGAGRSGNATGSGAAGGQLANVSIVSGSVQKIEGGTLTVSGGNGQVSKVVIGADTRLRKLAVAALADVVAGEQVSITGQAGADGVVAATAIQIGALR